MTVRPARSMRRVCGPAQRFDVRVRANGDDAVAANRDGLGDPVIRVHGDDGAIDEQQVGRGLFAHQPAGGQRERRQRQGNRPAGDRDVPYSVVNGASISEDRTARAR